MKKVTWVIKWEVASMTSDSKGPYIVALKKDGTFGCSCPHWIFRRGDSYGVCKHIVQVILRNNIGTELQTIEGYVVQVAPMAARAHGYMKEGMNDQEAWKVSRIADRLLKAGKSFN